MKVNHWGSLVLVSAVGCFVALEQPRHVARAASPAVQSITVLAPASPGGPLVDTQQVVRAPDGSPINSLGGTITDEHSSVFPPGALGSNNGYLFFVASGSTDVHNPSIGALPLISVAGHEPDANGVWTLRYPDDWGAYISATACPAPSLLCTVHGDVFLAPHVQHVDPKNCPPYDETFDLTYAAPGSVVADPTAPAGHLLMIYEGVNGCIGPAHQHPLDVGIATSNDYGRSWPAYCGSPYLCGDPQPPLYKFYPLPTSQNPNQGPNQPAGAFGTQVCRGNDCSGANSTAYGRYRILNQEGAVPSAFVDDMSGGAPYLYVVHQTPSEELSVSRIPLNGGTAALTAVQNWNGSAWCPDGATYCNSTPGPILKPASFAECGKSTQRRWQGSISYVDQTKQYLLTFVCGSDGDPETGTPGGTRGSAWFWATTSDLSTQLWSTPKTGMQAQEITGTWNVIDTCTVYNGWYPTFMSLAPAQQAHLSSTGYAFYMWGNLAKCSTTKTPRQYASRLFTMTIQ